MRPARLLPASLAAVLLCSLGGLTAAGEHDVIVLGAAVSLTGKLAAAGTHTKNGYELAVRKINDKGGLKIGGHTYRLTVRYYDDESKPARGGELAERIIARDGIRFMLGPHDPALAKAMLPVAEKHKVPVIAGDGATRDLFAKGYRYFFTLFSTPDRLLIPAIGLAADSAEALGKSKATLKVAIVVEDDAFAQDVRAGVLEEAAHHGMRVVIDDRLPPGLDDMSATLTRAQAMQPDVLVVSGQEKGALTAVTQIEALKMDIPIVAMTHCRSAQIAEKLGKAAEHVFCAHQWHRSLGFKDHVFGTAENFATYFEQTYQYETPYRAAQSAAAVQVYAEAFARAKSLDPGAVRNAIAAIELETFYGPVKFDASGRNIAKSVVLTQIQDGEYVVVAPAEHAQAKPIIPRSGQ